MYTMDSLVFFLVIRHGKEEEKTPVRVLYPMPREEKKEVQIAKRTKRAEKWAFFAFVEMEIFIPWGGN
jgi:hypothetical protein